MQFVDRSLLMLNGTSDADQHLSVRSDRASRVFLSIAMLAVAASVLLFAFGYAAARYHPKKWNPLGEYPTQQIVNRSHVVHEDGTVDVVAQKCARVEKVAVRTTQIWVSVTYPEQFVPIVTGGQSYRYRSCGKSPTESTYGFHNPIPSGVLTKVRSGLHVWRITGVDTPYDERGREGVPRAWTTEVFSIQ